MFDNNSANQAISNPNQFAIDVKNGLTPKNKSISSKYFYDEKGSALFNAITRHPDYYLTGCELEILENNKWEISQFLKNEYFNFIELGPGEGIKTMILLEQFIKDSRNFSYFMIDISRKYLDHLSSKFIQFIPSLNIHSIYKDYNEGLHLKSDKKNMVLFLGSSIGNFNKAQTKNFLNKIWMDLNNGDYFLIGFDLRKDIKILQEAYDDSDKITQAFNLNLLERINRELEADFKINQFAHQATYNEKVGAMESYLISSKKQKVYSGYLNQSFYFDKLEPIHVESAYKYGYPQIRAFAKSSGFKVIKNFEDAKKYFALSVWQVEK